LNEWFDRDLPMSSVKANVENIYPLTPMQQGMLFHALVEPRSIAYAQQLSWRVRGQLDTTALAASWNSLIARHAILRSRFLYEGTDTALQVVLKSRPIELRELDLRGSDVECAVATYKSADRNSPFNLSHDSLLRVAVLQLADDRYEIVWSHHHIVLDGWSVGLLLGELLEIYRARRADRPPALLAVPPFAQYVKWLRTRDDEAAVRFWTERLADYGERAAVPQTRRDGADDPVPRGTLSFALGSSATAGLHAMAAACNVTLATVLNAIWALLLARYSDQSDVVFGAVVSGRPADLLDADRMIGNFINTIPVRVRLDRAHTSKDLLGVLQHDAAAAAPHQYLTLSRIQSAHRLQGGLFDTLVSFANYPVDRGLVDALSGQDRATDPGFAVETATHLAETHYDVDVQFIPGTDLQVGISYDARCHEAGQMMAIEGHFRAVVASVIRSPEVRLDEIDMITAVERRMLLGNGAPETEWGLPQGTLDAAFEQQVAETPDRIAVIATDGELTYDALNRQANRLAHRMRAVAPTGPDDRVALLVGRGTAMAVALLAVLKAGGAYVPIEPSLPRDRVAYMIASAGCKVVLASPDTIGAARAATFLPIIDIDDVGSAEDHNVHAGVAPADLAYVIFTSGSSGRPKGVMIEHHSVMNLVAGLCSRIYHGLQGPLRVGLLASYGFDASVQQIFAALLLGHSLVIVDDEIKRDGSALNRFLVEAELDVIDGTPTLLQAMTRSDGFDAVKQRVRHAVIGGEALPWALAEAVLRGGSMALTNVYGPTECCVDVTSQRVTSSLPRRAATVPLGRPLPNTQVFVVGRGGYLAPIGSRGEICIAGPAVGRGYVNDEGLTASAFVRLRQLADGRVYRTGDTGRVLPNGAIEWLGRPDDQVKIRGFRIEIGEIEHQLCRHPRVAQAAVFVARSDDGDELRAALVLSAPVRAEELRAHLAAALPAYMIPSRFLELNELPRSASGKLDRKLLELNCAGSALPAGSDYAPPATEIERMLAATWQAVLNVARVGIDDNYLALGGDSIKAIAILSRVQRQHLRMRLRDLFSHPTIRRLAPFVTRAAPVAAPTVAADGPPALTAAQARFFAEHGAEPGQFHHAVLLEAGERLDPAVVGAAFAALRDRHDALRLVFDGEPRLLPAGAPHPDVRMVTSLTAALPELLVPFDLAGGPLHRIAIERRDCGDRLLIVVHHLCVDAVSWRILIEEFGMALAAVAAGEPPDWPDPTDRPFVFARRMAEYGRSDAARSQIEYWRNVEARAGTIVDEASAQRARYRDRAALSVRLDPSITAALSVGANRAYGTTPEDLLLTALARAIHSHFAVASTGVLLESHGRYPLLTGMDMSRSVGWFTAMYPFILTLDPERDRGFQIKSIKESMRAVPDNGMAYGVLRYLAGVPLVSRPQLSFNYLGRLDAAAGPLKISSEFADGGYSPNAWTLAELELSAVTINHRMHLLLAFNKARFSPVAMQSFLDAWRREVAPIIDYCQERPDTELTPSDLSYSKLTVDELEDLFR
jgi:amino acid adenylation domain-containing protein/non-ribosomal peptide synthase protein (TIGR01720 family)